ncbi:MAG: signal peptide peptidase SppA [Phycisphaerae bacterium]|nr:signal peptide peptidase SppA [Phycisphaerae bacterium]
MRFRATLWVLILGLVMPMPALAGDKDTAKDAETKTKKDAKKKKKKESPILRLAEMRIDEFLVPARMINLPLPGRTRTLQEALDQFDEWSENERIGAVLLDLGSIHLSLADIEELRAGIEKLKGANKKVLAFLNGGGSNAYLLACAADEIVVAPTGGVYIRGLGGLFPFMKGYYQMVGLEFEVITAGRYKYPGFLNSREPGKYFTEEFGALLDSWFGDYKRIIAQGRELPEEEVGKVIDIAYFRATQAQQRGLVDTIAYYDEFRDQVLRRDKMKRYRGRERSLADVNSLQDLVELINESLEKAAEARKAVGPKIAVLHARGPIIDYNLGAGYVSRYVCRDDFVKVVTELRKNKSIKAVVMRVDSPGGSGYASDIIWKQLRRLNETKPLVVSMGSMAASGGYYLACPARRIFAQPTTLTGSIGVLGIFRSAWSLLNRMDYEVVEMKRGARSLLGAPHRTISKEDREFMQDMIDQFYDIFINRVAQTRKIPAEEVRKIAEGRIYSGRDALKIGLIDELGGLAEAIEAARTMANIPPSAELKIVHYPRPGSLGEIFESFSMMNVGHVMQTFQRGVTAAEPVGFEEQLMLFSHRPQPLCWTPIPEFCHPTLTPELPMGFSGAPLGYEQPQQPRPPAADPLEQLIGNWR